MRLLLTIHHPLDAATGAPGVTLALRDAYRAAGIDVTVLSFDDLPSWLPAQAKELLFPLAVAARAARAPRPDVVDASTGDAWIWGRLRGALGARSLLVSRSHGLAHTFWDAEEREAVARGHVLPLRSRLYHGRLRLAQDAADLRSADLCFFLNADDRDRAVAELRVDPARARLVRNGIPEALIGLPAPEPAPAQLGIALIGSYAARKGSRLAASALAPLLEGHPSLTITYLGTRAPANVIRADHPAEAGNRVRVVERYDRHELPSLLAESQIYVSASLAEGLSLALIEAMACGLAPVVTDIPGARAVLDQPDQAELVPPGDAAALRDAVARLVGDPDRLEQLRGSAYEAAQRFGWNTVAREQLALYEEALGLNGDLPASRAMRTRSSARSRLQSAARSALDAVQARASVRLTRAPSTTEPERTVADVADPAFYALCRRCGPFTMTSVERMYALFQAIGHVHRRGLAGDVVECGVWRGGSSMLAALRLLELGDRERTLWLFDTFEGMPLPGEHDADPTGARMADDWERHEGRRDDPVFAYASLDHVRQAMTTTGYPAERVRYVPGKVEDTIPADAPAEIAILRLDTDWYESTRHELKHLYPRLVPGGLLIIDDYGHWQGARRAVDEWLATVSSPPLLTRIDETGRIGVKPG